MKSPATSPRNPSKSPKPHSTSARTTTSPAKSLIKNSQKQPPRTRPSHSQKGVDSRSSNSQNKHTPSETTPQKPKTTPKSSLKTSKLSLKPQKSSPSKTPPSPSRTILRVILLLVWVFLGIIVSQIIIGTILYTFLHEALYTPLWTTVYTATSYIFACFLIIFLPTKFKKPLHLPISRTEIGLDGLPRWRDILLSIAGFIIYFLLAALLASIFSLFPWFDANEPQNIGFSGLLDIAPRILAFISLVVVAPIAEEIIFRGWLYAKLRARIGIWLSIILVSVLFGLAHGAWNVGVNVFALSVVMCLLRELTGTIHAGIILHILKNAIAFCLLIYTGAL